MKIQFIKKINFFNFRSWLCWKVIHNRFNTLLEQFLFMIGSGREKIINQVKVTEKLKEVTAVCQENKKNKVAHHRNIEMLQKYLTGDIIYEEGEVKKSL